MIMLVGSLCQPLSRFPERAGRTLRLTAIPATLFLAALVGVAGGLCAAAFREAMLGMQWLLTGHTGSLVGISLALEWWQRLLVPTLGGLMAGLTLHFGARFVNGQKSTDYMEALAVGNGAIPMRPSLVKSASSLLSIAFGASIGREGSMVQLAATSASWLGQRLGLSPARLRVLTACGVAAGVASVYDAPISGALFVSEIILGSIAIETLGPLLLAAAAAAVTTRYLGGAETYFRVEALAFVSPWEAVPFLAMGIGLGVVAPGYVWMLRRSRVPFARLSVPLYVRLGLGGALVGAISVYCPQVWGNGRAMVNAVLAGQWLWGALAMLLVCKLAATVATVGSGAVGGVFTPTLFTGAMLGSLVGVAVEAISPGNNAGVAAFAVVAMGGFLAATTRAPMTAMFMVFEMTLDYGIVLPLIITSVTAAFVAQRLSSGSLYSEQLQPRSAPSQAPAGDVDHFDGRRTQLACVDAATDYRTPILSRACHPKARLPWSPTR
jgi:chloride channel protein, CIC family